MMSEPDDAAIEALFGGALADFTASRDTLAKRLKPIDAAAATRVRKLAKPSVSAWAVNQLWWRHRDLVRALMDAGEQLRRVAATHAGPVAHATAGKARRLALGSLTRAAQETLREGGHAPAAGTMRKVTTSLEAVAAYGHHPTDPPLGQWSTDLAAPGFALLAALGGAPPPAAAPSHDAAAPEPAQDDVTAAVHAALARALDEARTAAQRADHDVAALSQQAEARRDLADAAQATYDAAMDALRQATRVSEAALAALQDAQTTADATVAALQDARLEHAARVRAVDDATAALLTSGRR